MVKYLVKVTHPTDGDSLLIFDSNQKREAQTAIADALATGSSVEAWRGSKVNVAAQQTVKVKLGRISKPAAGEGAASESTTP